MQILIIIIIRILKNIYFRSPVFISHVESMKAVKSSVYSATGDFLDFFCGAYLEFLRKSALWRSGVDLLLITEPFH